MREVKSKQRRRRLRLIQAEDQRTAKRFHNAVSALTIAADTEAARIDADALRQRLLVDCKARSRTRLRVEHPGAPPLTVVMDRPYFLIGADPACDLILDHEDIWPHHCFLQWVDGQIFCCDIAPRSSHVTARRQPPNGRWLSHEPIAIGPYHLQIDSDPMPPPPDYSPLDRSCRLVADFPQFALQFKGVEQRDNQWPVNRVLTMIGRGIQCKLRLNHDTMPNVQACLLRTKNGCWLVDVDGTGSTGVNGRTITIASIDIGDVLQLGPFQVEVVTTVFEPIDVLPISNKLRTPPKPFPTETVQALQPSLPPHSSVSTEYLRSLPVDPPHPESPEIIEAESVASVAQLVLSNRDAMESCVGLAVRPVTEDDSEPSASEGIPSADAPSIEAQVDSPSAKLDQAKFVTDYIESQQAELALLKVRLNRLKDAYERASSKLISRRVRRLLEKSAVETFQSHRSMTESLTRLIELVEAEKTTSSEWANTSGERPHL